MTANKWLKLWFFFFVIFGILPYIFFYFYLKVNYENNTYKEIVSRQIKNKSIYGTALNQNTFSYKLELIKEVKPKIVALGSSRVMQFRDFSFNTSFVNAGGAMNHLNEGLMFVEKMYKIHKPEILILGLDFWWFNDNYAQREVYQYHQNSGDIMTGHKIFKTLRWFYDGKISFNTIHNMVNNKKISNKYTDFDNLGFRAITTSDGYRSDGSKFYSSIVFGINKSDDIKFKNTFQRVDNGNARFQYGKKISKSRVKLLEEILKLSNENNVEVILVIPPIANAVYRYMQKDEFQYDFIDDFRNYIKTLPIENYDFHNLSIITEDDCECVDGFHGGDVVYQRMLKYMDSKNSLLSKYLNMTQLNTNIINFKGCALTATPKNKILLREVDFLDLGCEKVCGR